MPLNPPRRFNPKIDKKTGLMQRGYGKTVMDPLLIHREYYNPNKFAVDFELRREFVPYILRSAIHGGPARARLEPDSFLYLPHGYYIATAVNGAPVFDLVTNYGQHIGIGNKKPNYNTGR